MNYRYASPVALNDEEIRMDYNEFEDVLEDELRDAWEEDNEGFILFSDYLDDKGIDIDCLN